MYVILVIFYYFLVQGFQVNGISNRLIAIQKLMFDFGLFYRMYKSLLEPYEVFKYFQIHISSENKLKSIG